MKEEEKGKTGGEKEEKKLGLGAHGESPLRQDWCNPEL